MVRLAPLCLLVVLLLAPVSGVCARTLPEGYVSERADRCLVVVPERNSRLADDLLPVCRATVERVFEELGVRPDDEAGVIEVRTVGDPSEIGRLAPPHSAPPTWSTAVAFPEQDLIILALRDHIGNPIEDLDIALAHEVSHLALRRALGDTAVPRWFSEGIAIQQSERSSLGRYVVLSLAARGKRLLSLADIERYPDEAGEVSLAYAEAADFVGFLIRKGGWLGLRVIIRHAARGEPFFDAVAFSYGSSLATLEGEWRAGLSNRWQWLPIVTGTGALWGVMVVLFLVAYAANKRRRTARLAEMEDEDDAALRLVEQLEGTAPKAPAQGQRVPTRPRTAVPRIPTKIRVDDDIHTLH